MAARRFPIGLTIATAISLRDSHAVWAAGS
jgi:hypothetical protein